MKIGMAMHSRETLQLFMLAFKLLCTWVLFWMKMINCLVIATFVFVILMTLYLKIIRIKIIIPVGGDNYSSSSRPSYGNLKQCSSKGNCTEI
jgi:hypothetical protein